MDFCPDYEVFGMRKIAKVILIVFSVLLILGMLSCTKKEDTNKTMRSLSFLDYNVVYAENISKPLLEDVRQMFGTLIKVSQKNNGLSDDSLTTEVKENLTAKEILIGHTRVSIILPKTCVVNAAQDLDEVEGVPSTLGNRPFDGVYNSYDGASMMYWTDTTEDMAMDYAEALEENGFSKHQELDNDSIRSATYYKDNSVVHIYYLKRTNEFRVITQNDD